VSRFFVVGNSWERPELLKYYRISHVVCFFLGNPDFPEVTLADAMIEAIRKVKEEEK
jgi:hypothetical protein